MYTEVKSMLYSGSFSAVSADQMLEFSNKGDGNINSINLAKDMPNWKHITVEVDITAVTGAGTATLNIQGKTSNNVNEILASTNVSAVKANGSTAFESGNVGTVSKTMFTTSRSAADGSTASNIGALLGFLLNVTTVTSISGNVRVLVTE